MKLFSKNPSQISDVNLLGGRFAVVVYDKWPNFLTYGALMPADNYVINNREIQNLGFLTLKYCSHCCI